MNTVAGSLNAAQREADLTALANGESVDVLVIGGGVTGAGVALDAVSRGLSVALVERRDLANGTSRQSSKLIHGGLRYLRQLELGIAWESARERHILMSTTAPHLVKPLPFLAPLNRSLNAPMGLLTETGIRVGDLMRRGAGSRYAEIPGTHRISSARALELAPGLRTNDLRGALMFWDGQAVDDARIVICLARTAAAHGARVITYCSARAIDGGMVELHDERSRRDFTVRARAVVNATGVWATTLAPNVRLRPSKGSHLIVNAAAVHHPRAAVVTPVAGEKARWVGCTPVGDGRVIVGVTDDPWDGEIEDEPQVTPAEQEFLLDVLGQAMATKLTSDDVIGSYAGFRPLLESGNGSTADISRRHTLIDSDDGQTTTIVGGKFTTYRKMAEDTVDHVCAKLDHNVSCCTTVLPLLGAAGRDELARLPYPRRLLSRYGTEAAAVARPGRKDASLLQPIAPGLTALGAELRFGIEHEGALTASDLLDRRLRLGVVPRDRELALPLAEHLMETAGHV